MIIADGKVGQDPVKAEGLLRKALVVGQAVVNHVMCCMHVFPHGTS